MSSGKGKKAPPAKTAPLSEEYRLRRLVLISEMATAVITAAFKWVGLVAVAFFFYKSIDSLSGKHTIADIVIGTLADLKVNEWVAYAIGGAGVFYGLGERKLRRKRVAELAQTNTKLETLIDPNRTSSGLKSDGTTPHDK